jgi:hypothetical protein
MPFEYFDLFPIWVFGFEIKNDSPYIRRRRPMYWQLLFKNDDSRTPNRSVCLQRMWSKPIDVASRLDLVFMSNPLLVQSGLPDKSRVAKEVSDFTAWS